MATKARLSARKLGTVQDGQLTQEQALTALRTAAQRAVEALPAVYAQCQRQNEFAGYDKAVADLDGVIRAYRDCLAKTLRDTGSESKKVAEGLAREAVKVRQKTATLKDASEAIRLFAELMRLAVLLAGAFA